MRMVLATNNQKKLKEMKAILMDLGVEVCSLKELGVDVQPEENGTSFEENAMIKAKAVMEATGLPALADDSGLVVDALGGAPGIYSARYGGENLTDEERYQKLLEELENVPEEDRSARFVCAIVATFPDGQEWVVRGECEGVIQEEPSGEKGFGYDPVFFLPSEGKTMAELSTQRKNKISHRAIALMKLKELFNL